MDTISPLHADAFRLLLRDLCAHLSEAGDGQPDSRVVRGGVWLVSWYLRSLGDHDTHRGELRRDGTVQARCGAVFTPRPTLRVAGPPPGELVTGDLALRGRPPDPEQVCPECDDPT